MYFPRIPLDLLNSRCGLRSLVGQSGTYYHRVLTVRLVPLAVVKVHSTLPLPSIGIPLAISPRLKLKGSIWPIKSDLRRGMDRLAPESMTIGKEGYLAEVSSHEFVTPP